MFDSGLQSERTELAWRRTALSMLVGSFLAWRLLAPSLGWWAAAIGLAGLLLTASLAVLARRRSRRAERALSGSEVMPDGGVLLLLAASAAAAGLGGVIYVLV
ncbi:MAG TPA: DUF202 domain-containing protein [Microlunatus sp.]|nr:DUF202 domain-containing protein [Microlunatus sp.]